MIPLNILPIGQKAKVRAFSLPSILQRRLLDLGLICDTEVQALQKSPAGDPIAYSIRGAVIALRAEESSRILVELVY